MTKVRLHPALLEFRGAMKDMLFRQQNGKTIVSVKPNMSNVVPTPAQIAHRERFSIAVAYGKTVMADPTIRALYQQVAKERNMPLFAVTVADFMNPPSVKEVDLSAYDGQVANVIKVKVADDFGVVNVHVTITNTQYNEVIESSNAVESGTGSGLWLYNATTAVAPGTEVNVRVVATDRPGDTGFESQLKAL